MARGVSRPRLDRWSALGAVSALVGALTRLWVLHTPMGLFDGDEAIVGLIARDALHGHFSAFYWGQPYGGTGEPLLAAPVVAVFGSSPWAVKVIPIALNAVSALVLFAVGRRLFDRRAGIVAASLSWCWSGALVWWSTKANGFTQMTLLCSMLVVLAAIRIDADPHGRRNWVLLGAALGVGWWQSPQIVLLGVPAVVWLAAGLMRHHRASLKMAPVAIGVAMVAAIPWWMFNLRNHWASLDPAYADAHGSYVNHLWALITRGLPMILGAKEVYSERWLWWRTGAIAAVFVVVALVWLGALGDVMRWPPRDHDASARPTRRRSLLVTLLVGFTVLYAAFPNSSYVGPGRYQLYVAPVFCLALARVVHRQWWWCVSGLAIAMVVTVGGLQAHYDNTQPFVSGGVPMPRDSRPLVVALEGLGRPAVYTDYWVTGPIRFESGGRIDAASLNYYRDRAMQDRVEAAPRTVWVYVIGAHDENRLDCALDRLGVGAQRIIASGYEIVVPERTVRPGDIPADC